MALRLRDSLALLNCLPFAPRHWQGIGGDRSKIPIDPEEALQVGHLTAEREALPQSVDHVRLLGHIGVSPEQGNQGILLMELFSKKLPHVSAEQVRGTFKLKASDGTVPEF